ncbi:MAG: cyclase family protein [Bryobacteraceae bacterium]
MSEPPRFAEVSHPIEPGMRTYPGLPPPEAIVMLDYDTSRERYQSEAEFYIASLHLCGNTGTYVDAPIHRYRDGIDLADLPLYRLAHLPAVVFRAPGGRDRAIGPELFDGTDVEGKAVLVHTGWSRYWSTERYFEPNPYLTGEACELLVSRGAYFVGIDSLNIDNIEESARPAHTILLGAGIPVCEHMTNLVSLPDEGSRLHAVPIAWRGGASFPVRAYAILPSAAGN